MNADVAYLDASAAVKLLVNEPETEPLRSELRRFPRRASSLLLHVELLRAIKRQAVPSLLPAARRQLQLIDLITIDTSILDRAAYLDPPRLRSFDAVHLATALALGADLGALFAYDERLIAGAAALGLPISSPR